MYSKIIHKPTFFFTSYLFIQTCSQSSDPKDDTITISPIKESGQAGTVTLEGATEHSGNHQTVQKPVELDTTLTRIQGIIINIV